MKKFKIIISIATLLLVVFTGCKKDDMDMNMAKNINYPAAYVVNGESGTLSIIKLSDNTVSDEIMLMDANNMIMWPHHIYLNPSKSQLAIGVPGMDLSAGHSGGMMGMNGAVVLLDPTTGIISKNLQLPIMNHNAVYVNNGSEIWTSQMDSLGKVLVYDANTYALKNTINVGEDPAEVTISTDGTKAYVCNGHSNTVSVINPTTKAIISTINVAPNPVGAWPSSIGKMFVDCEDGQTIDVIDVGSNLKVASINLGFMPGYAAYNSSVSELWVTDPMNNNVVWYKDMGGNNWMKHGEFVSGGGAHAIAFSGTTAYVTNQTANTVSVINATTHTVTKTLNVGKKPNGIIIKQ